MTMLGAASLLTWSESTVRFIKASGETVEKPQRVLKEEFFLRALEFLDRSHSWERAIDLLEELRLLYQTYLFDFERVSELLSQEVSLFKKIVKVERFFVEYYRVSYLGMGFKESHRNKDFIYKGYQLEKLPDFVERLKRKFGEAEFLNDTSVDVDALRTSDKCYVVVNNCKPSSEQEMRTGKKFVDSRMPERVRRSQEHNNISVFSYQRRFRKRNIKTNNEFEDLWITTVYLRTDQLFPGFTRRALIQERVERVQSPIENAISNVVSKSAELERMVEKIKVCEEKGDQPEVIVGEVQNLGMVLSGMVDAAVNGGIAKYEEAFLNEKYITENPDGVPNVRELVAKLRTALSAQRVPIANALEVHRLHVSKEMMPLQQHMDSRFAKLDSVLRDL